jgi:hypothetical protein
MHSGRRRFEDLRRERELRVLMSLSAALAGTSSLDDWRMTDVLAAAASDGRGGWLLEIYGDAESADLSLADAALRLLTAHAVRPAAGLRLERRPGSGVRAIPGS